MSSPEGARTELALEELARRRESGRAGGAGDGSGGGRGKRLFMAGRLGPESARVRYGSSARSPVEGPWDLALVIRPG